MRESHIRSLRTATTRTRRYTNMYTLSEHEEEELIGQLNEVDSAWRESYDSPLDAAYELLPEYVYGNILRSGDDYAPLDFN